MSAAKLVEIAIERVQPHEATATDSRGSENKQTCHICQQFFKQDDIRTTHSCCQALHHAECLSEWLVMDRGLEAVNVLPKCTRCKAAFYPNSFHYAMAQLATRSLQLSPHSETRAVSRIRLEVRPSVEEELYYNPATLLGRALRVGNAAAARVFQDGPPSIASRPLEDIQQHQHAPELQNANNDIYGEGFGADRDEGLQYDEDESEFSMPYEEEAGEYIRQESFLAAEVRYGQYHLGRILDTDEEACTVEHVEHVAAHIPADNGGTRGDTINGSTETEEMYLPFPVQGHRQ